MTTYGTICVACREAMDAEEWWPTTPRLVPASEWTQRVVANVIARHDTAENP